MQTKEALYTGLLQQPIDPRDVWADEVLLGSDVTLPSKYNIEGLNYEYQGHYPFCASFAATTLIEWRIKQKHALGEMPKFSQPHLFFHAGGSRRGSFFRKNLDVALKNGVIPWDQYPMPDPHNFDITYYDRMRAEALNTPFDNESKILGYARVKVDKESIKRAIFEHGPVLVGVRTNNGYYSDHDCVRAPDNPDDTHAILITGWDDEKNRFIRFDSLRYVERTKGYHSLSQDYGFNTAYVVTDLPENWRDIRDNVRAEPFETALNHYGERRNLELEKAVASEMVYEFERFNNQSVMEAAGRFWTVYINAIAYGSYSLSYERNGEWMSGDVINDCYNWRRTGKHIFDFNKKREDHRE